MENYPLSNVSSSDEPRLAFVAGMMGCGCGGQDSCVYNIMANPRYTWFYNNGMMGGQVTLNCCGCMAAGKWD